jgi:hypothetical protein
LQPPTIARGAAGAAQQHIAQRRREQRLAKRLAKRRRIAERQPAARLKQPGGQREQRRWQLQLGGRLGRSG